MTLFPPPLQTVLRFSGLGSWTVLYWTGLDCNNQHGSDWTKALDSSSVDCPQVTNYVVLFTFFFSLSK